MATTTQPRAPKDRGLTDMRRFHRSLDLAAMWNEFYVTVDKDGRPKYKTARQFAITHGRNQAQRELLVYVFGPKPGSSEEQAAYPFADPLDFDSKRESGGWFCEANIKANSKAIVLQINALEALRMAGNGITIHSLARMEQLARQLDKEFQGQFFVEGLNLQQNMARAQLYVSLHQRILAMIGVAQDLYAKAHGINFQDMSGFAQLVAAQALSLQASSSVKESRTAQAVAGIVEMALSKAAKYQLELPADVEGLIVRSNEPKSNKKSVM